MRHGLAQRDDRHPLYDTWKNMRARCYRPTCPHYKYYGGRGIAVCDRWSDFAVFVEDMAALGDRPDDWSIDRIDVNGNYEPGNVRWASPVDQSRNRREFVTANEQKTHCKRGHAFDEANTRIERNGKRSCRACDREKKREERGHAP